MKKITLLFIGVFFYTSTILGQGVSINENGDPAHASAMLDVSSTTGGMLIPRMPYLQRIGISGPATGLLVYQTNEATGFYVYNGSAWEQIWAGTISIDDLSDGAVTGGSVYLGSLAGYSDDGTNNYNVAIGTQALRQNNEGFFNVAAGYQALYFNTDSWNSAFGYRSLHNNTTGEKNSAFGFQTGFSNNSGNFNTLLGYNANFYNQTGSNNTIVGFQAGFGPSGQSKSGNVFLGFQAGYSEAGSNKLYIENSDSETPLIYGEFDNDILRVNGTLHMGTAYHFPLADGTSGQVLATDGSGTVGWTTVTTSGGPTALNDLTDAKTGGGSVFLGADAGASDNGVSTRNIALGQLALYSNIDGKYNAALGYEALNQNISGNYNIALGYQALYTSSASRHTAVGHNALYYNSTGESNTAFGHYAGRNNSTGNYNTLIGYNANLFNQTGSNNTILGYKAGSGNALHSKSGNVFLGYNAGFFETGSNLLYIENSDSGTPLIWGDFAADSVRINGDLVVTGELSGDMGIDGLNDGKAISSSVFLGESAGVADDGTDNKNTALGYHALESSTGEANVAIGNLAAENNTTGNYNISIGSQANGNNTGGVKNVIIGHGAGYGFSSHTKTGNVFIGYAAGLGENSNNKLFIENSSSSSPLLWGDFEADSVMINGDFGVTGKWVGIGIDDLYNGRTPSRSVYLGHGAGANDDGSFNSNVAVGDSALYTNTWGEGCTSVGYKALYSNISGFSNTSVGMNTLLSNTTGHSNTAIGYSALHDNIEGDHNNALGYAALYSNETGNYNCAIGFSAMQNNNSGNANCATGEYSLYFNYSGNNNTANGYNALYYNGNGHGNTAIGKEALLWNQAGNNNTAVGTRALCNNTSSYLTAVGDSALYSNTTGENNTALGSKALVSNVDGLNNVAMGNHALYWNINGSANTSTGYKALYHNDDAHYNTATGYWALYDNVSGDNNTAMGSGALSNNTTGTDNSASGFQALMWNHTGINNTAVGSNSGPGQSYPNLNNTIALGYAIGVTDDNHVKIGNTSQTWIGGQVTWSTYSDERMKENIREDVKGLDFIMKLRPVTYHVNKDKIDNIMGVKDDSDYPEKYDIEKIKQSGFLAQEVEQAAIESGYNFSGVTAPANENTPYSISYAQFVVPLVKSVQEQQVLIDRLILENNALRDRLEKIESSIICESAAGK